MDIEELLEDIRWKEINNGIKKYKKSTEYKKYNDICNNYKQKNKNIVTIIENQQAIPLDKNDTQELIEYLKNENLRTIEEEKLMIISTVKNTYDLLKKFDMIKD